MQITHNRYNSLLHKLFKTKSELEKVKSDLAEFKKNEGKIFADNAIYQDNIIELRENLHLYQKQESEKTKTLVNELFELKKQYQKALQDIEELKNK